REARSVDPLDIADISGRRGRNNRFDGVPRDDDVEARALASLVQDEAAANDPAATPHARNHSVETGHLSLKAISPALVAPTTSLIDTMRAQIAARQRFIIRFM